MPEPEQPVGAPATQEDKRAFFLFLVMTFFFLTQNNRGPPPDFRHLNKLADDEKQRNFDVLANSTFGQFATGNGPWLNLTGFREDDAHHWDLLPTVKDISRGQLWQPAENEDFPFYDEINGQVKGNFIRSGRSVTWPNNINLTTLDPSKEYFWTEFYKRNITSEKGSINIALTDEDGRLAEAREVTAEISIGKESSPQNGWEWHLRGVHFPYGGAILTSTSSKFDSLPALPHFAWDEATFTASQPIMNKTLTEIWGRPIHHDLNAIGVPHCELVVYLQPNPLLGSRAYLRAVEHELLYPEGIPIGTPPLLSFSATIFSPDCGFILTAPSLTGAKTEAFTALTRRLLTAFIITIGMQIALIHRQMKKAAPPSLRARVAFQSIVIAALGDGLILFLLLGLLISDIVGFLVVAAAFFMSCLHVAFFEVKFVFDVWHVQIGEPMRAEADRQRRARQQQTPATTTTASSPAHTPSTTLPGAFPAPTATDTGATPLPTTNPTLTTTGDPTTPTSTFASLYYRFYFSLVILLFLSLFASTWPPLLRSIYTNTLVVLYFSLWLPQIHRNAIRNCRKALQWEYVLGTSVLRAAPVLYWYVVERNVLGVRTGRGSAVWLGGWLGLQVVVLGVQWGVGPRLGLGEWGERKGWWERGWEWSPVLIEGADLEGGGNVQGMDVTMLRSGGSGEAGEREGRRVFDCAICMAEIDVPVVKPSKDGASKGMSLGLGMERAKYMVTPCGHIFHAECLEGWMGLRLVCPVCRESLPPL